MRLIHHLLERSADRLPNQTALICGENEYSYRDIDACANQLAASLIGIGLRAHDRVIIYLENTVESVVA